MIITRLPDGFYVIASTPRNVPGVVKSDFYWNGDRWDEGPRYVKVFPTQEAAETELATVDPPPACRKKEQNG